MEAPGHTRSGDPIFTVSLRGEPRMETPSWATMLIDPYQQAAISYLLDPANSALVDYVLWYANRRDAALTAMSIGQVPPLADGMRRRWGYDQVPWPWQLADAYTIDSYQLWLMDTGAIAAPTAVPTQAATGEVDCAALGFWLGGTVTRFREAMAYSGGPLPAEPDSSYADAFDRFSAAFSRLRADQERAEPPFDGTAAHASLLRGWGQLADAYATLEDAARSGDDAKWDEGLDAMQEGYKYADAAWVELTRLADACGVSVW